MRHPQLVLALALCVVVVLPAAAAGPRPALYFLRDADQGGPVLPGVLAIEVPDGQEPSLRPVPVATDAVVPVQFVALDSTDRPRTIRGPVFAGMWTDASPSIDANLSATLYESKGGQLTPLASNSINLQANASKAPNATTLVPPDPNDPQGAVFYEVAQVTPMVMTPASLIFLGSLNIELAEGSQLLVGFSLINASGAAIPVPQAAFATLRYDAQLSPSYLFVPYWEPNPTSTISSRPATPTTPRPTFSAGPVQTITEAGGDSPSATALLALVAAATALVVLGRRR